MSKKKEALQGGPEQAQELLDQLKRQKRSNEIRLKDLEDERKKLEQKHPTAGQKLEVLAKEVSTQTKLIERNSNTISEQQGLITDFKYEIRNLKNEEEVYQLKLQTQSIVLSKAKKDLFEKNEKINSLKAKVSTTKLSIEESEKQISSLKAQIERQESSSSTLEVELDRSLTKTQFFTDEHHQLKSQTKTLEKDLFQKRMTLEQVKSDLSKAESEFISAQNKFSNLKKQVDTLEEEVQLTSQESDNRVSQLEKISLRAQEYQTKVDEYTNGLAISNKKIEGLNQSISTQAKTLKKKEARFSELNELFDVLTTKITDSESEKEKLLFEIDTIQNNVEQLTTNLNEKNKQAAKIQDEVVSINASYFASEVEKDKLIDEVQEAGVNQEESKKKLVLEKNKYSELVIEVSSLERKKAALNKEIQEYHSQINNLKVAQEEKNHKKNQLEIELKELNISNIDTEKKIIAIRSTSENCEKSIKQLKQVIEKELNKKEEQSALVTEQQAFLDQLTSEETSLKEKSEMAQIESEIVSQKILDFERSINHYEVLSTKHRGQLVHLQEKAVEDIKRTDKDEKLANQLIHDLFQHEDRADIISQKAIAVISTINKDVSEYRNTLFKTNESIERKERESKEKIYLVSELKKKVKTLSQEIQTGTKKIEFKDNQIKTIQDRIADYKGTIDGQVDRLQEVSLHLSQSEEEITYLNSDEKELVGKIHKYQSTMETKRHQHSEKQVEVNQVKNRVNQLNIDLEKFQTEESAYKNAELKQEEITQKLAMNASDLESCVADYRRKVAKQQNRIKENKITIDALKERTKALSHEYGQLTTTLEKFENQEQADVKTVENIARYEQKMNLKVTEASIQVQASDREYGLQVTFANHLKAIKQKLETKFFNMNMDYSRTNVQKITEYDPQSLTILDECLSAMVSTVEATLGTESESLAEVKLNQGQLQCSLLVSNLNDTHSELAKGILSPVGKSLLEEYSDFGLSVSYRVKIAANGRVEKLGVLIKLPYQENQKPQEIQS